MISKILLFPASGALTQGMAGRGTASTFFKTLCCCTVFALAVVPAFAAKRVIEVEAPASAAAGKPVTVVVRASTDAAGEQVGFLHAEHSVDNGRTWKAFCYEKDVGGSVVRTTTVAAGGAGSTVMFRARAAFRGGPAGDVDYRGTPIQWDDEWKEWKEPPARSTVTKVTAR